MLLQYVSRILHIVRMEATLPSLDRRESPAYLKARGSNACVGNFTPELAVHTRDALSPEKTPEFRSPRPRSGLQGLGYGNSGAPGVTIGIPRKKSGITEKKSGIPNLLHQNLAFFSPPQ